MMRCLVPVWGDCRSSSPVSAQRSIPCSRRCGSGYVSLSVGEHPVAIGAATARIVNSVLAHGSTGSAWMRLAVGRASACPASSRPPGEWWPGRPSNRRCITAASSSSADPGGWKGEEKAHGPGVLIEKLIPGHLAEVRPSSRKEPS